MVSKWDHHYRLPTKANFNVSAVYQTEEFGEVLADKIHTFHPSSINVLF